MNRYYHYALRSIALAKLAALTQLVKHTEVYDQHLAQLVEELTPILDAATIKFSSAEALKPLAKKGKGVVDQEDETNDSESDQ